MAEIKEDGIYETADGSRFQFRKGHVVDDMTEFKRVGDFPEPAADVMAERHAKAAAEAENKAAPAPANKSAKA